jgi:hypothetical protein
VADIDTTKTEEQRGGMSSQGSVKRSDGRCCTTGWFHNELVEVAFSDLRDHTRGSAMRGRASQWYCKGERRLGACRKR